MAFYRDWEREEAHVSPEEGGQCSNSIHSYKCGKNKHVTFTSPSLSQNTGEETKAQKQKG